MGATRAEILPFWIFLACMAFPISEPCSPASENPPFFGRLRVVNLVQTILIALFFVGFIWWPQ